MQIDLNGLERSLVGVDPLDVSFFLPEATSGPDVCHAIRAALARVPFLCSSLRETNATVYFEFDPEAPQLIEGDAFRTEQLEAGEVSIDDCVLRAGGGVGEPQLRFTVCEGMPSGVLVGMSLSHVVCDGVTLFHLLNALSQSLRGISGERLERRGYPGLGELDPAEICTQSYRPDSVTRFALGPQPEPVRMLTISRSQRDELHQVAKAAGQSFSDYQLISAMLMKEHATVAVASADEFRLRTPVDFRGVHPDVSFAYVGNAFFDAVATFSIDELGELSFLQVADRVAASVGEVKRLARLGEIYHMQPDGLQCGEAWNRLLVDFSPGNDLCSTDVSRNANASDLFGEGVCAGATFPHYRGSAPAGFILTADGDNIVVSVMATNPPP